MGKKLEKLEKTCEQALREYAKSGLASETQVCLGGNDIYIAHVIHVLKELAPKTASRLSKLWAKLEGEEPAGSDDEG